ncbi:hypothetical protein MTY_2529 [Moorella thermoacetica Y72]|uniref:Uncharacterized protein n=1 Tax=Moorella thermoacetica Y72 TaxID=1325331 RepID=A0A0S6UG60_NEOTH|nr:hypothetical protein MTY_2529 [Moorella thermoacetica Y72]
MPVFKQGLGYLPGLSRIHSPVANAIYSLKIPW